MVSPIRALHRGFENSATDVHRLGVYQDPRHFAWPRPVVDPGMVRATLHHHVSRSQVDDFSAIELHVQLTLEDNPVVDGVRAMHGRTVAGSDLADSEYGPAREGNADLPL